MQAFNPQQDPRSDLSALTPAPIGSRPLAWTSNELFDRLAENAAKPDGEIHVKLGNNLGYGLEHDGWLPLQAPLAKSLRIEPDNGITFAATGKLIGRVIGNQAYVHARTLFAALLSLGNASGNIYLCAGTNVLPARAPFDLNAFNVNAGFPFAQDPGLQECPSYLFAPGDADHAPPAVPGPAPAIGSEAPLSCVNVDTSPRYELPAKYLGTFDGYECFWRPCGSPVMHRRLGIVYYAKHDELMFVSQCEGHTIALNFNQDGTPRGAYVNINRVPERHQGGWIWRDLELDMKLTPAADGTWESVLIDVAEFNDRRLSAENQEFAFQAIKQIYERLQAGRFPLEFPKDYHS